MGLLLYIVAAVSAIFTGSILVQILKPVKKLSYAGQHVIVTGGSQGMGKAIAKEFVNRGAHVTIIARTQETLDNACAELTSLASGKQSVRALSVDCTQSDAIVKGIEEVGTPDIVFCCAGRYDTSLQNI